MDKIDTKFAPPERENNEKLEEQSKKIQNVSFLVELVNSIPEVLLVLNSKRQIVYSNNSFFKLKKIDPIGDVIGLRPGELLNCIHSNEMPGGCGTSETCMTCGAVNAIIESLGGSSSVKECRIETEDGDYFDLRVYSNPFAYDGEMYSIFTVNDISNEKRREIMERIFFHDIMNTAGGLKGFAELLKDSPEEAVIYNDIILKLSEQIIDEINSHKILTSAENNKLTIFKTYFNLHEFADKIKNMYHVLAHKTDITIDVELDIDNLQIYTDETILTRVVGNMMKNAIEASNYNQTVKMKLYTKDELLVIEVHNEAFINRVIQLQLFQRSFSTKGIGRGLGTYSIKLLGEKYLGGKVSFETDENNGTSFFFSLKLKELIF